MRCTSCGKDGAYIGFRLVECSNADCRNFKPPPRTGIAARVHWNVNGRRGNSRSLDLAAAEIRAEQGNAEHGDGTHWVIKEDEEGDDILWNFALP